MKHDGGVIPGVLTLGRIGTEKQFYIVDGQHRVEAFKVSDLPECIADVRMVTFDTMADMAEEFVHLNSRLVNMRPDDILRGLEESIPALRRIREGCDFVGYTNVRRGATNSPMIGMSQLLRAWHMSNPETPAQNAPPAITLSASLDNNEADKIIVFMNIVRTAWGNDPENFRLWGSLNMTICMWLWRRLVLDKTRGVSRYVVLNPEQFRRCMMAVSADQGYVDWLVGRNMTERERSPCFVRLKALFIKRLSEGTTKKVQLPLPSWASR